MSVVTKRSSIPVAILAITLLTASLPAECEKLSTLKLDRVYRRQTVSHTSSGNCDIKVMKCVYNSYELLSYSM